MTEPTFSEISRGRVADDAILRIKEMIIAGELHPFEKLPSERELADSLGVSRPTMREAIRALVAMNICESRHGSGTYVTSLEPRLLAAPIDFLLQVNDESIETLFETRRVLETSLAGFAAIRATRDDIATLERLTKAYQANLDDLDICVQLDLDFHEAIARASGNAILEGLLGSITELGRASRRRTGQPRPIRDRAHADHRAILRAIRAGDSDGAQAAMEKHLRHVATILKGM